MPLAMQTMPPAPNAVYAPQIVLQTTISGGKLKTCAQIMLAAANLENAGEPSENWTPTGQANMLYLADLDSLDDDLIALQSQVSTLYAGVVAMLDGVNAVRKLL